MKCLLFVFALFLATSTSFGQDLPAPDPQNPVGENLDVPADWVVRLDKPKDDFVLHANKDSTDIWFVTMTPGWHITSGPAAIYYHPASTAAGNYTASSTIHLFDPEGRNEAYGLFFGGENLDADNQSYLYFLLRNDRSFLVKHRGGSETHVIVPWTKSDAVVAYKPGESSVKNDLSVVVTDDSVAFVVNGTTVHEMAKGDMVTDGVVGLRINHGLNVHVSDLKVTG